jgi:ubiquitin carboxyl-terminal hydrolase 4/11/15
MAWMLTSFQLMISEVYKEKFYKHFEDYLGISDIGPSDTIVAYELDEVPTSWPGPKNRKPRSMLNFGEQEPEDPADSERILVPVFLKRQQRSRYGDQWFGVPFFVVFNKEEANDYHAVVEKIVDRLQFLTTQDLYAEPPRDTEEDTDYDAPEVIASAPEAKETQDEEKDGFVDVSMKDAVSASEFIETDSEPEAAPVPKSTRRRVPLHIADLFSIKISKQRNSRLPTGFSNLEADLEITERFQPTPIRCSSPRQEEQRTSFSITPARNSGRISPTSQVSDEADLYQEPPENMMQDSSEDEGAFSNTDIAAFQPQSAVPVSSFYGSGPPSANGHPSPPRSPCMSADTGPLVRLGEGIILEFTEEGSAFMFEGKYPDDFRGQATWEQVPTINDPELARRRELREQRRNRVIHLEDCLDEFAKEEVLSAEDPWYCPRCKAHKQASKKFELWKCPDILVIHLKRFSSSRSLRDKIDAMIDCPIEGLDLSKRVGITEGKPMLYDLIAVDNHYGGLGGGHYTASVKNWFDGKWYYCDGGPPCACSKPIDNNYFYRRLRPRNQCQLRRHCRRVLTLLPPSHLTPPRRSPFRTNPCRR